MCAAAGAAAPASMAAPGPGTFSTITSPKTMIYKYDGAHRAANTFIVSGKTSGDVTSVDIDCISMSPISELQAFTFGSAVPVTSGSFPTTALPGT